MISHRISAILALSVLSFLPLSAAGQNGPTTQSVFPTESAKFSYAIGLEIGESLKQLAQQQELDLDPLFQAIGHALKDEPALLNPQEANEIKQNVFQGIRQRQTEESQLQGQSNLQEGQAFLATNQEKEGVTTTESGLQYQVLREGAGEKPVATDKVKVHYRGTLLDGTEFDSSYQRGEPISFALNGVIPGWTEGVQLMTVGSQYRLFIPADLAYGERGAPPRIAPNATLIFEIELLAIEE